MKIAKLILILFVALAIASTAWAADVKRTASIAQVSGDVSMKNPGDANWQRAVVGALLREGAFVKTGPKSKAVLNVDGDGKTALVNVSEKSQLSFAELIKNTDTGKKKTLLDLTVGEILIKAEKLDTPDSKFEVKTPTSVVGVRGTKFSVKVEAVQ